MPLNTKRDKGGQLIAEDLLPLTPIEEAVKTALTKEYHKAGGNISLTARTVGWSRPKALKMIKRYGLYSLYKHEPWPEKLEK